MKNWEKLLKTVLSGFVKEITQNIRLLDNKVFYRREEDDIVDIYICKWSSSLMKILEEKNSRIIVKNNKLYCWGNDFDYGIIDKSNSNTGIVSIEQFLQDKYNPEEDFVDISECYFYIIVKDNKHKMMRFTSEDATNIYSENIYSLYCNEKKDEN